MCQWLQRGQETVFVTVQAEERRTYQGQIIESKSVGGGRNSNLAVFSHLR